MTADFRFVTRVTDTNTQAMKIVANVRGDITQTVMPTVTAVGFELNTASGYIELIMGNQQLIIINAIKIDHRHHRLTRFIHKGQWHEQAHIVTMNLPASRHSVEFFVRGEGNVKLLCQMMNEPKPGIMTRKHILLTRITKTDNKFYGHKNTLLKFNK